MNTITLELLDALLNPSEGRSGEEHFSSIILPSRVHGLFSLLINTISPQDAPRSMLACVLLRRDISSLGVYTFAQGHEDQAADIVSMLGGMVDPLLNILGQNAHTSRLIGFVIAEVCAALSLMDTNKALMAVNNIIKIVESSCSSGEKTSLDLVSTVAQSAPFALASSSLAQSLPSILQNAANAMLSNSAGLPIQALLKCANSILEAMSYISIAYNIAQKASSNGQQLSNNPKERMVQMIQLQTLTDRNPKKLNLDSNSPSAMMGKLCLGPILQLIHSNYTNDTEGVRTIMQSVSQCASNCPSMLVGDISIFTSVCQVLLTVASKGAEEARLSAVEALVSIIAVPGVKDNMKNNPSLLHLCIGGDEVSGIQGVVKVCAEMIVTGVDEDANSWAQEKVALMEDASQWEYDDNAIFAESILEAFLRHVGGSQCLATVLSLVESILSSSQNQWQSLRAGLSMLEICLTSAPYSFATHFPAAVEAALTFSSHQHVRVQFQAIQLLAALCRADGIGEVKSPGRPMLAIRHQHGNRILAALSQTLNSKCSKVIGHACLAVVAYCRGGNGKENAGTSVEKALVSPFIGDLLTAITNGPFSLEVSTNIDVFVRAFAAVACLANVVEEDFAPYYHNVMPGLVECASYGMKMNAHGLLTGKGSSNDEVVYLRGGAIEAATILGQAVGTCEGIFHADAEKLMQLVLSLLEAQASDIAPTFIPQDQLLAASARIACVMEAAFVSFLPRVLPHMLSKASEKADVSITDGEASAVGQESELDEDTGMETITISLPGLGVKKMTLNTTQMQEKSQAARSIYEHANCMGANFGPFARDCIGTLIPLVQFKYAADVRTTAAQALGPIFESACEFAITLPSTDNRTKLPNDSLSFILLVMSKQLLQEEDDDIETLCAFSEAMSNITYCAFSSVNESVRACLNRDEAKEFVSLLVNAIERCLQRRTSMIQVILEGSLDDDSRVQYEELLDEESQFLTGLVDSIGYTLKSLKDDFMEIFDKSVAPIFGPLLKASGTIDSKARFGAVCLFDDCIEHCGREGIKYAPLLASAVQEGINDDDIGIREASVYGISQIARKCGESLQGCSEALVQKLASIARNGALKVKDDIEDIRLVENSSSALATMTLFKTSPFKKTNMPRSELLDIFISNLPLQEDFDEAKFCHDGFCDLVEGGEVDINTNLDKVFEIMGEVSDAFADGDEMATQDTVDRFANILSAIQNQVDHPIIQNAYSNLSEEAKNGINMLTSMG